MIKKTSDELDISEDLVHKHVYGMFKYMIDSMNRFEHEKYILEGFASFNRFDYRYKHALTTYSMYSYLNKYNRNKKLDNWDWLEHNPDLIQYKKLLLDLHGNNKSIKQYYLTKSITKHGKIKQ